MGFPYRLHELAHQEFLEACEWYELRQQGLGERFMNAVEKRLSQISEHPEYYNIRKLNFREAKVPSFPYTIVFEFLKQKKIIHIAAIYHTKRNPRRKYRRRR